MNKATETGWGWSWAGSLSLYRRSPAPGSGQSLGNWGEWLALVHLRRLGWDIVARNWRTARGEIDLIAYDGPCLAFVEVKTRRLTSDHRRPPEQNFSVHKGRRMEKLAFLFLRRHSLLDTPFRLDLIAIETRHRKDFRLRHYLLPERRRP